MCELHTTQVLVRHELTKSGDHKISFDLPTIRNAFVHFSSLVSSLCAIFSGNKYTAASNIEPETGNPPQGEELRIGLYAQALPCLNCDQASNCNAIVTE